MGDYACFVVRCDPAKAVPVIEALKAAGGRDVQMPGNGQIMGVWKSSGGPGAIGYEIDEVLYGVGCGLDSWQIIIVHERHNARDTDTAIIEV